MILRFSFFLLLTLSAVSEASFCSKILVAEPTVKEVIALSLEHIEADGVREHGADFSVEVYFESSPRKMGVNFKDHDTEEHASGLIKQRNFEGFVALGSLVPRATYDFIIEIDKIVRMNSPEAVEVKRAQLMRELEDFR